MSHDVFISYSTKDMNMALHVCHVLEQNGIECWIAPRNILSNKEFAEQVADAVKSGKLVVLIGSYNSFNSKFVTNEISLAFNNGVPILPFLIDAAWPQDKIEFYIRNTHWLSAFPHPEEFLEELLNSVMKILNDDQSFNTVGESDVFIAYSSKDTVWAEKVCHVLEQNNFKCWIAPRDIPAGQDFARHISEAIKNAKIVFLIYSQGSQNSSFIFNELEIAFKSNKPIFAFNIDYSDVDSRMKYYLKLAKWRVGYPDHEGVLDEVVGDVAGLLLGEGESVTLKRPFDAYSGDEPYIFVSYAHKDSDLVFTEIEKFHDAGYPVWYDQGLTAGQEWDEEIEDALMDCSLLVVFISENSMASNNVVDEIKLALEENIDIVPIYLEDAKLAKGLKLRLSQKHAIFKYNSSEEEYLMACFKAFDSAGIPKAR